MDSLDYKSMQIRAYGKRPVNQQAPEIRSANLWRFWWESARGLVQQLCQRGQATWWSLTLLGWTALRDWDLGGLRSLRNIGGSGECRSQRVSVANPRKYRQQTMWSGIIEPTQQQQTGGDNWVCHTTVGQFTMAIFGSTTDDFDSYKPS